MSSYSSTTDEEDEKIKEAVDGNFLTEDLYTNDKLNKTLISSFKPLPSLRNQNQQETSVNPFSIKVTPEFQKHVAKNLTKLLDALIDDSDIVLKTKRLRRSNSNRNESGVRLLISSKNYLQCTDDVKDILKPRKLPVKNSLTASDYEERAKEVAVTSEWVLSQKETRYWASSTKGEIEIVKIDEDCEKPLFKKKKKKKRKI